MSRPKRINLAGCVYHVLSRAEQHNVVFTEDKDKERFLEYLTDYMKQFDMRIHAYCLMDTHFHLLIESRKPNLSEFMRRLLTAYTVWFHKKHRTHGHLFSGRFKSLVVEICSQLSCQKGDFIKMKRKTGLYKKAMIQLIVRLRKESEWTFRHIGQYLKRGTCGKVIL